MKFLYKIWSGYDGFTPRVISDRLQPHKVLALGWNRYIDVVEEGHEVWVYFYGPRVLPSGVYAKGFVRRIDTDNRRILLRLREYCADKPLTDPATSRRVAGAVAARGLQVFVYPEAWDTPPECTVDAIADSCRNRLCDSCTVWKKLPLIQPSSHRWPWRFPPILRDFAPAYWVIPSRCYLYQRGRRINPQVGRTSELFYRFKAGEANLAYPLALGIYHALRKRKMIDIDCVIPIPLSPDKAAQGEIYRTRLIAQELSALLDVRVEELLTLTKAISKHRLRTAQGFTAKQFERAYLSALAVDARVKSYQSILVIDDVATDGSTVRCAVDRIHQLHPEATVVAATCGQMILKHVVADEAAICAN